jgi:hypothetical protein
VLPSLFNEKNYTNVIGKYKKIKKMQDGVGRGGEVVGGEGRMRECLCCVL